MTTDRETSVAAAACKRLAARWGRRRDWREFWGLAWVGVSRAAARGVPDRHLATAACRDVIDVLRVESPTAARPRGGPVRPPAAPLPDGLATPERPDPPERRLAELWADTRRDRAALGPRVRLWLCLWLVEGWTQAEVAAAWGVSNAAVSISLRGAARRLGRGREFAALAPAVRGGRISEAARANP